MPPPINEPEKTLSESDRTKALEHVLASARYTLEYFESSARQVEDKSRNNLALGTAVVGVGALIAKTDEVIKYLRPVQQTIKNVQETSYPSTWVYLSVFPLIVAASALLYLANLHYNIQKAKEFEMITPEDIRDFREKVKNLDSLTLVSDTAVGLSETYIKSAETAEKAFDEKSKILPNQEIAIQVIFWSITIYIAATIIFFLQTPIAPK
jgi:uncharacterized membrane protein YidH (DUF202 family)